MAVMSCKPRSKIVDSKFVATLRSARTWIVLVLVVSLGIARPAAAQNKGDVTAEQIRTAIDRGRDFLLRTQNQNGSWPDYGAFPGGVTALCTLALLNAGVPLSDPQMQRALDYVRNIPPDKTYVVALQTMVLCMAEPQKDLLLIKRNATWLEDSQKKANADRTGSWGYGPQLGTGDRSNTQFAMLALHEAERIGVPIRQQVWSNGLQYWVKKQSTDGSWNYYDDRIAAPGTGSMTCAGVTSVYIASLRASDSDVEVSGNDLKCCAAHDTDPAVQSIENGLAWLGNNFTLQANPGSAAGWLMYYLYGIERVGRMTSHRFFVSRDFKNYDWYRMGAETLVERQDSLAGYWKGEGQVEQLPQISTSFALLFLSKGRRPVLISKAKFGQNNDWDRHRSDLADLTSYVETKWKKEFPLGLSWQIVDLENATVEDLLQTPVLYISGSLSPPIMDQAKKLRDYIDRGGFIFAEACCGNNGFDQGFRDLMDRVFDEPEYRLKPVPPEHPLWTAEEPVRPSLRPNLWAVDYGCRTSVVYAAPPDARGDLPHGLSCYWEVSGGRDRKFGPQLKEQIDAAYSMGINILAYATNRELKSKDEQFELTADVKKEEDPVERGKRYIANIRHPGGCDAAPGALASLMRAASRELKSRFSSETRQVKLTDPDLFNYDVLFMHGRTNFRFTDAERKQLRKYLEKGTIIGDSICASKDFTEAFRREMNELMTDKNIKLEPIPATHPMFTREFGGYDLSQVMRREPRSRVGDAPLKANSRRGAPELEGLKVGDRYAVIFSPYDLSCALEKHDSLECEGYTRDDAERIGLNILLYTTFEF
jgi:hypothetical protein